jgi:hypothetical protein
VSRARGASIPDPLPPRQPHLNRRLRRWLAHEFRRLSPLVTAAAADADADRYRKHFTAEQHLWLLLFDGLTNSGSLAASYDGFASAPGLVAASGLTPTRSTAELAICYSQVAASNTSRPAEFLAGVLDRLLPQVRAQGPLADVPIPLTVHLLDSTFIRLCASLAGWLPQSGRHDITGVRAQIQYQPALDVPERVLVTTTRRNDCQGFDLLLLDDPAALAPLADETLSFDLGYYSHRRFVALRAARVHFVTRRHAQAALTVVADEPVQAPLPGLSPGRIAIRADQRVTVGSPHNRAGAVLPDLRLVTADVTPDTRAARHRPTPVRYELLTDRWDLSAADVVQLYLWRWEIELFFRWLKHGLHLLRPLGTSENAVLLTIWLTLLVHVLCRLAAAALGEAARSPRFRMRLQSTLLSLTRAEWADVPEQLPLFADST